jgi:hypothetical protein
MEAGVLTVVTFWWGDKYPLDYVEKLYRGFERHLQQEHRFAVVTDKWVTWTKFQAWPLRDPELTKTKGCFARLRIFDPDWQHDRRIYDRLICVDLDTIVTGPLDHLFDRPEPLVLLHGGNSLNPCPFNGSIMMLRPGAHPEVWRDFTLEAAGAVKYFEFPDDQGWLWAKTPNAAVWHCGRRSGIYAFQKPGWPRGNILPPNASLVVFPGWRDPSKFKALPWIRQHWL